MVILIREWLLFRVFRQQSIPQVEFTITTHCNLRCKDCTNYIPQIKHNEHRGISIERFKVQLYNLSKNVREIKNLLLIGGETLLVPNLEEYIECSAQNEKVKKVWIITNGTLLLSPKVKEVVIKYKEKVTIWISNYSSNIELKGRVKYKELISQLKESGINSYFFKSDSKWTHTSAFSHTKYREESSSYFLKCLHKCVAVFDGFLFVCPRAGVFYLKSLYKLEDNTLNLNHPVTKKQLIDFYSRNDFRACKYCNILEERNRPFVTPALQIDNE